MSPQARVIVLADTVLYVHGEGVGKSWYGGKSWYELARVPDSVPAGKGKTKGTTMGFFDRFFGKKKEEPPRTPTPAYVPPEPPPLPTGGRAWSEPTDVTPEPAAPLPPERAFETRPLADVPPSEPAVSVVAEPETQAGVSVEMDADARSERTVSERTGDEVDFSLPSLSELSGAAASALPASALAPLPTADPTQDQAVVGVVGEVVVGATRLETPPSGLDVEDLSADEADFDIPAATDGDRLLETPVAPPAEPTADGIFSAFDDEDDLEGFDDAFDSILAGGDGDDFGDDTTPAVTTDQSEVRTLFSEIAANYIRPVKAFMIELRAGAARKEWLEMCQPAISSLGKSALGMGMEDVSDAAHDFESLLSEARASREGMVSGELRERILENYQLLTEMLPATFVIDDNTLLSEGMIVNSLLKQIPEVGKVTIDKLYRAGLITIESFLVGAKEDLAVATGLPIWLAEKIVEKFKSYQQQLESGTVQSGRDGLLTRLEQLTRDLQDAHEAYEIATTEESNNPSATEDRRFYRQARQETQLQINVLLAELGAVELANEIQRLSFEKRIERLRRYVADERPS